MSGMSHLEFFVFCFGSKKRFHTFHFKFHLDIGRELAYHFFHGIKNFFLGVQCGTDGCKQMGVVKFNGMLLIQLECSDKGSLKL